MLACAVVTLKNQVYTLDPLTPQLLDAIAAAHGLHNRSQAMRFALAALEPIYLKTQTMQSGVVVKRGPPDLAAERATQVTNDDIRGMPLAVRNAFVRWRNSGVVPQPSDIEAVLEAGFPRERLESALGIPL